MIRLLDRYLMGTFLAALAVFTVAFVALFVTIDFATKLGRFLELTEVSIPLFIAKYYLIRIPLFLTLLLPAVVLFAAMFTVIKLSRTNEILPIAAAGTSLRRMARPFLAAGVFTALAMAGVDEYALPGLAEPLALSEERVNAREVSWKTLTRVGRWKLFADRYDHVSLQLSGIIVTEYDEQSRPARVLHAAAARWDDERRRWVLVDGRIEWIDQFVTPPDGGRPELRVEPLPPGGHVLEAPFKPENMTRSTTWTSRFPCATLRMLRAEAELHPDIPSIAMKVHTRLAFPLSPLILLLLGLPFVIAAHSKSFFRGLFVCLLFSLAYYVTFFACMELGNRGSLPSAAAGWGPTAAFGMAGATAFARMRT